MHLANPLGYLCKILAGELLTEENSIVFIIANATMDPMLKDNVGYMVGKETSIAPNEMSFLPVEQIIQINLLLDFRVIQFA